MSVWRVLEGEKIQTAEPRHLRVSDMGLEEAVILLHPIEEANSTGQNCCLRTHVNDSQLFGFLVKSKNLIIIPCDGG